MSAAATMDRAAPAQVDGLADMVPVTQAHIDDIVPDPAQPRLVADDELKESIDANGVLQPIIVRKHPDGSARLMIVDGERRWRGAVSAGLETIPVRVRADADDEARRLILQSVANTGKPLSAIEEAKAWRRVQDLTGMNIAELARELGRPKSTVSDRLALADAPEPFQKFFAEGVFSAAAAPIVRQFVEVPNKTLEKIAAELEDDWQIEDARRDGEPVPLDSLKRILEHAVLEEHMREVPPEWEGDFSGKLVKVKDKLYTPDIQRWEQVEKKRRASTPVAPEVKARREKSEYEIREAARRRKQVQEARKKAALRRAQFDAVAGKLRNTLDLRSAKWLLFLVRGLLREMTNDGQRAAVKALGLEPEKRKSGYGIDFQGPILRHAETLSADELEQLLVKLVMAPGLEVSQYSASQPKALQDAAALAKVDLKKVKLPPEVKPGAKKSNAARDFLKPQQPDAVLAAIVGEKALPRTEVTKKLWAYIKRNGLQNTKERRLINADAKLKLLFGGKKQASMFEMTKFVNKHLKPAS